ncbi:hypothetical protein HBH98_042940 [Parastagonospora nodorum]|nr:hypothetical protein HBH52_054930 [Parastagonospora nodorum]KAH4039223.1 hypothetical protein HBI09_045510 [Parastagonospora nodorum]KAH4131285.1 hypothetical protein HBH47_018330 [Parastagonospora nodorum]KAH4195029.1 hypothetical protein HBH42_088060 [Parastagonospora nodorum]KAH4232031.1 hypothetical protein HBI06_077360 [Parastagonospora nodorum]
MATKCKTKDTHGGPAKRKKPANGLEVPADAVSRATRSKSKSKDPAESDSSPTPAPMTIAGKPEQQKTNKPWSAEEKAYLEIMYQKLHDAAASKSQASLPHARKVFNSLNSFFNEGRQSVTDTKGTNLFVAEDREWGSFDAYIRRPTNKLINGLRKDIMKKMNDDGDNAWIPDITEDDIKAHLKHGPVIAKSGATKAVEQVTKDTPAPLKKAGKKIPKATIGHTEEKKSKLSAGTNAFISEPTDVLEAPKDQQHMKHQFPSHSTKRTSSMNNVLIAASSRSPTDVFKGEVPVKVTPVEEVNRLVVAGYKFTDIPEDDEEAMEKYLKEDDDQQLDGSWIKTAGDDLDKRIERRGLPDMNRMSWPRDLKKKIDFKAEEWHNKSGRVDGAAAVNGLRGIAVVPPLGYTGSIEELVKERRLLSRDLLLEDASKEAIDKVYSLHKSAEGEKKPQHNIEDDDSDITGDESS